MKRVLWIIILCAAACLGQTDPAEAEEDHLREALALAGSSPIEFIRAVEKHLAEFPETRRREDLERAMVMAAIDAKDDKRILLYGERVLEREQDDLEVLEKVTGILLSKPDQDSAARAWKYAQRYEEVVRELEKEKAVSPRAQLRLQEEIDGGLAKAFVLQARAAGNLGKFEEAVTLARRSYDTFPAAESARETGVLLSRMDRKAEALKHFADAFTIADPRNTEEDRAKDRKRMGEIYRELNGWEAGLGDLVLEAYDRTSALLERRRMRSRLLDPNAGIADPMDFTLSALNGEPLKLTSLRNKVLVFDFWATWCGPCRVQHPLYEEVKQRFKDRADVMFVSVNTDGDRGLVGPFLQENGWTQEVYLEDGLSRALRISSIPTTIVANKRGEIVSRLVGFLPDRFVDMLTERIEEALAQ